MISRGREGGGDGGPRFPFCIDHLIVQCVCTVDTLHFFHDTISTEFLLCIVGSSLAVSLPVLWPHHPPGGSDYGRCVAS